MALDKIISASIGTGIQLDNVTTTSTGSAATGAGQVYLNGTTSNRVDFNTSGVAPPAYTTRSAGTKVALYPALGASSVDYALGIDAGALWTSIPGNDAGQFFKWYGGTTQVGSLSGTGMMNIIGTINAASYTIGGKQAVNGPAFRAYIAAEQVITSGSQQKVTFGTETFDTDGNFASNRFTPTVEGYYQLNATVRIEGNSGTGEVMITIWKNGSEYARGTNKQGTEQGANWYSMQVSDIAYANGSSDYFEIYIQQTSGGNRNTTAGANISYFSGAMVRGA